MSQAFQFKAETQDQGKRLDKFLSEKLQEYSRAMIQKMIKEKNILIKSRVDSTNSPQTILKELFVKSSYKIKTGDVVEVKPLVKKTDLSPDPSIKIKIIHDEKDFAVIDKPAGLVVYPGTKHEEKTLVNGLLAIWPEIKNVGEDPLRPGMVHRLDKDTSGIMIIAKNNSAFEYFKNLFKDKKIDKTYTALTFGHIAEKVGQVDFPIRRSENNPVKQVAVRNKSAKNEEAREALTFFKTLKYFSDKNENQYTLVEAKPKTGRMHQIRVHLSAIGHPIVGDKVYQTKNITQPQGISRQLLHASAIKFHSPHEKVLKFTSPFPKAFSDFLKTLTDKK